MNYWRRIASDEGRPYDIVSMVLGLIIVIAPWAFDYMADTTAAAVSWIAGAFIIVSAAIALSLYTRLFREVNAVLGVLTALSPWILRFESDSTAATVLAILGFLVALVSAAELLVWREPGSELRA